MKIASWNVNSLRVRLPHVLQWLAEQKPDVLAMQETKTTDDQFPHDAFREAGYHVVYAGQKTYNGVAIASRAAPGDVVIALPDFDDEQKRVLVATIDGVRIIDLYVPNGESVGSEKYRYKLAWLAKLKTYCAAELQAHSSVVVLGDFNIAPEDRDVHDPAAWYESVLCSTPERDALRAVMSAGLRDTFRLFEQPDKVFSWWDYRMMAFRRNMGLRIDLVLASDAMAQRCTASYIDKAPRKLERPSDHAPVVAEFR